jgi:hypothetical protein
MIGRRSASSSLSGADLEVTEPLDHMTTELKSPPLEDLERRLLDISAVGPCAIRESALRAGGCVVGVLLSLLQAPPTPMRSAI